MTFGYFAYLLIFLALTITVSMVVATSRQALLVLLVFWFVNCLMAAPVVTEAASALYPLPNSFEIAAQIEREMAKKVHFTVRTKQIEEELMAKYRVKSPKELPVDPGGLQELEEQRINNGIYNRAFESIYATYAKQDLLYQLAGVAAPMLAVQSLSMGLAGNDTRAHAHYDQAARAYRNYMLTVLNEDTAYRLSPGSSAEESLRGRELWEKVPPFVYKQPDAGWVLRHYRPALAALAAWLALTVFAARYVFARRSV